MMKKHIYTSLLLLFTIAIQAQIGINSDGAKPHISAMLDIKSTNKGMLMPSMTTIQRTAINNPATGLLVFDVVTNSFWFYNGTAWADLSAVSTTNQIVDADNDTKIQVEETADEDVIRFDTNGTQRMMINNNGFVGVESSNPSAKLTVNGTATTNVDIAHFSNANNAKKAIISLSNSSAGQITLLDGSNNTDVFMSANNNTYFNAANVGVGNNNPQEKLHVTGNIRMEDDNQASGKVMTSDANGTATWATMPALNTIEDTDNDTKIQVEKNTDEDKIRFDIANAEKMILNTNGLGIGTTNPSASLDIVGTLQFVDGKQGIGKVLTSDGLGHASWAPVLSEITDADNDTKIQVEATTNDDTIRFDVAGAERFRISVNPGGETMAELPNNDSNSTYFGFIAGAASTSGKSNTFIGKSAGALVTTGSSNTFLGRHAGAKNLTGNGNTYIGRNAGANSTGSGNIFLGSISGANETGDNKLYIENSNATTPLIYGEFDNDLLRVNGTLNINNEFSFPTTNGTANQFLKTDGNGILTWGNMDGVIISTAVSNSDGTGQVANIDITGDLEVGGTVKFFQKVELALKPASTVTIGSDGTPLSSIIKVTVDKNLPQISYYKNYIEHFDVPDAKVGDVAYISSQFGLSRVLLICYVRVSEPGVVEVKFRNESQSKKPNHDEMEFYITVIQ